MANHKTASKLALLLFGFTALLFWGLVYPNHLIQREQWQLFLFTGDYFLDLFSIQGGFAIYLGEFFVQFFKLPWVGPIIITLLLIALVKISQQILRKINPHGSFLFLAYVPAAGYWLLLMHEFYYVSGIIGFLLSLFSLRTYLSFSEGPNKLIYGLILLPLMYWLVGGACLVLAGGMVVQTLTTTTIPVKRKVFRILFFSLAALLIPLLARKWFLFDTLLQSYLSEAYYKVRIFFPLGLQLLFLSVPLAMIIQSITKKTFGRQSHAVLQGLGTTGILLFLGFGTLNTLNLPSEREMKFDNLVYQQQWSDIIQEAGKAAPSTKISRIAVNLALLNTGQIAEKLFQFNSDSTDLFLLYERRGQTPLMANETYFYLGLINFSQMLAVESLESTIDAKKPVRAVKRIAENYLITGQYQLAEKFLNYLKHTFFYRKWALMAYSHLYDDEKISAHPLWGRLRAHQLMEDFYYNGSKMELALMYLLRNNLYNKPAYEYLMASFLLKKNLDDFINYLPLIKPLHYNSTPTTFQEALVYIETLLPQMPELLKEIPVSNETRIRLQKYASAFKQEGENKTQILKNEFGQTFWYYIHFK